MNIRNISICGTRRALLPDISIWEGWGACPPKKQLYPADVLFVRCLTLALLAAACVATPVFGHPYHISSGEAEWNAATSCLEVAIGLIPQDLETAIGLREGRPLRLEEDAAEKAIHAYVEELFVVTIDASERVRLRWVGMELNTKQVWVYFEVPLDQPPSEQLRISNRILFDVNPAQANYLTIRVGNASATWKFTNKMPAQRWKDLGFVIVKD